MHRPRKYEVLSWFSYKNTLNIIFPVQHEKQEPGGAGGIHYCFRQRSSHAFLLSVKSDTVEHRSVRAKPQRESRNDRKRKWLFSRCMQTHTNTHRARAGKESEKITMMIECFFPVWGWTLAENMIRIDTIRRSHHHSLFVVIVDVVVFAIIAAVVVFVATRDDNV